MDLFWRSVAIGVAAYFIAAHIPFLTRPLEWVALGWAGYWFARQAGPRGSWLHAAAVGALAAAGGFLASLIVSTLIGIAAAFGPVLRLLESLLVLPLELAYALVVGAICGTIGWYLARRGGRRRWRRWDREP